MPLAHVPFAPGLVTDDSATSSEGTYTWGNRVRFVRGKPQSIGGWQKRLGAALTGVPRGIYAWQNRTRDRLVGIGTNSKLYVVKDNIAYDITPVGLAAGAVSAGEGGGYGTGFYGTGYYGASPGSSGFLRHWSLDAWGDYMLAVPRGGELFEWQGNTGVPAAAIAGAPTVSDGMFVDDNRYVVLLATQEQGTGQFNPMLVRWCDQDDPSTWNAASTNKAGEYPLSEGGRIVAGRAGAPSLIWTDTALYQMRLLDADAVFGFPRVAKGCGLIGSQAVAERDGQAFWMGSNRQFFGYAGGAPEPLDCPLTREIFDYLDENQADKIVGSMVGQYDEVEWHYPDVRDGDECSRYAAFNFRTREWSRGERARTARIDAGVMSGPLGCAPDGWLYDEEWGASADGAALGEFIETGAFDLEDGEQVMRIGEMLPDLKDQQGIAQVTVFTRYEPQGAWETHGPFTVTSATRHIPLQAQGRQAKIRIAGVSTPSFWRLGAPRLNLKATGMKR